MIHTQTLVFRGVLVTWAAHACGLVVAFFVTPVLLNGLGDATYGIWSIVMALTSYYGLADLGIGKASTKYIAQYDALNDDRAVRRVVAAALVTYAFLGGALLCISGLIAWNFPQLFGTADHAANVIRWVVILTGIRVSIQLLFSVFRSSIIARKRLDIANILAITSQITVSIAVVLIVRSGGGLLQMAAAMLAVAAVIEVCTYLIAVRGLGLPRVTLSDFDRSFQKMLFKFGAFTVLARTAQQVGTYGGTIIVGSIVGPAAVAYFAVAESLTSKCLVLGKGVCQAVMPFASQLHAERQTNGLVELVVLSTRILIAMAFFFVIVLLVFGRSFVSQWISPEFASHSYLVFCVLALALLAKLPANGMESALIGMGQVRFLGAVAAIEGISILLIGVVMVYVYGVLGMAWTIVLCQFVARGLAIPAFICKHFKYSIHWYVVTIVLPSTLAALPGLGAALLVAEYLPARNLAVVCGEICLTALIAVISAAFICMDSASRRAAIRAVFPSRNADHVERQITESSY